MSIVKLWLLKKVFKTFVILFKDLCHDSSCSCTPAELKNKFTRASRNKFGEEPGALKKATIEALQLWIEENKEKSD